MKAVLQKLPSEMDSLVSHQSSGSEPDPEGLQQHVGFFRKLGYSTPQVEAALSKLGLNPDINSVLEELVQTSTSHRRRHVGSDEAPHPNPLRPSTQNRDSKVEGSDLRPVVIDGSNVAMSHGNKEVFSCRGIQLAVTFFLERGHKNITVFVPTWRKEQPRPEAPISDQHVLMELEKNKIVVFTPSRRVGGKRVVCYDDRFIVKLAYESDGVIVSNDTYRDLQGERPEWKKCIEERLLMFSFVNDKFMPPDDPLGRRGPSLDNFLSKRPLPTEQKKQLCPYDKKCTYGNKCKFFHPERVNRSYVSLADELREKANISKVSDAKKPTHSIAENSPRKPALQTKAAQNWTSLPTQWDDPDRGPHLGPVAVDPQWPYQYHNGVPYEYLDSGFGSFESLYSDCGSHTDKIPHRLHPEINLKQPCVYSSLAPPSTAFNYIPKTHESPPKGAAPSCHRSLPAQLHTKSSGQYNWSNPFQGAAQVRTSCSPQSSIQASEQSIWGSTNGPYSWGQQPNWKEAFGPQRQELRQKLHSIFNPHQVDTVMEMFPHVTDAEKLAAEILNMRSF